MSYDHLPQLALSLRQPWLFTIMHLGKPVENRSWPTKVRGPICLHASKGMRRDEFKYVVDFVLERFPGVMTEDLRNRMWDETTAPKRGGIIATAEIVDCVAAHESPWFFGPYAFTLANVQPVPFIPVRGALGFFDWRQKLIGGAA